MWVTVSVPGGARRHHVDDEEQADDDRRRQEGDEGLERGPLAERPALGDRQSGGKSVTGCHGTSSGERGAARCWRSPLS